MMCNLNRTFDSKGSQLREEIKKGLSVGHCQRKPAAQSSPFVTLEQASGIKGHYSKDNGTLCAMEGYQK
jgi:hypothetical protein